MQKRWHGAGIKVRRELYWQNFKLVTREKSGLNRHRVELRAGQKRLEGNRGLLGSLFQQTSYVLKKLWFHSYNCVHMQFKHVKDKNGPHWNSLYPALKLHCPSAWPQQASVLSGCVTVDPQASLEGGAQALWWKRGHPAQTREMSQLPLGHFIIILGHILKCKTSLEQSFTCTSCTHWHTCRSLKPIGHIVAEYEIYEGKREFWTGFPPKEHRGYELETSGHDTSQHK